MKPDRIVIRSYQVGFGDCFLVSFRYPKEERHVLIDFGSTGLPDDVPKTRMRDIARDIAQRVGTGGKLAVVATHRHRDHISGFATTKSGKGSGDIVRALEPKFVTQPWTEDPDLEPDATGPAIARRARRGPRAAAASRVASLWAMQTIAEQFLKEIGRSRSLSAQMRQQLGFLGENNLANLSAVRNLMTMADNEYVFFGRKTKLSRFLPGVDVDILGPPTVDMTEEITKQRSKDADEFWHLMANAAALAKPASAHRVTPLFPRFEVDRDGYRFPMDTRWLIGRAKRLRTEQMLRIVRALDDAMNNTSVILLFRAGGKSLLFPGDAQLENWQYALSKPEVVEKLRAVDLYKVGHHGSLNATPKSLWKLFGRRSQNPNATKRLTSVMSTMLGKHGHEDRGTEVPRKTLTTELRRQSNLVTTQALKGTKLCHEITIELGG